MAAIFPNPKSSLANLLKEAWEISTTSLWDILREKYPKLVEEIVAVNRILAESGVADASNYNTDRLLSQLREAVKGISEPPPA